MNLFLVAVLKNGFGRRKFLVQAATAVDAVLTMENLNRQEIRAGDEPLKNSNETLSVAPVEFEFDVCEI